MEQWLRPTLAAVYNVADFVNKIAFVFHAGLGPHFKFFGFLNMLLLTQ